MRVGDAVSGEALGDMETSDEVAVRVGDRDELTDTVGDADGAGTETLWKM
jgi:hypothetical protein